jgi:thymidylate synthase (FAD)
MYRLIEQAGRVCYASDANMQDDSAGGFIRRLIGRGHEAMLEHSLMSVLFTVDRGVSHELVRHRMASFAQESTRYCNYRKDKFGRELTYIEPPFFNGEERNKWEAVMNMTEVAYLNMLEHGATPEEARSVLPNSLKTRIVMTANLREWRHVFKLRASGTTGKPHPQMAEVMVPLFEKCRKMMPEVFDDIMTDGGDSK